MYSYHVTGFVSTFLSLIASAGLATQVRLLWNRRRMRTAFSQPTTAVLSINRFITSYVMFLAIYTYGAILNPFNHYLVWPRVLGVALSLFILYQINSDQRNVLSCTAFYGCMLLLFVSNLLIWNLRPINHPDPIVLTLIVIIVCSIYVQGGVLQIRLICKSRSTGGLSRQMYVLFVCKDISLVTFSLVMGTSIGWPIFLLCAVGLIVNLTTLGCFHWIGKIQVRTVGVGDC